MPEGGTVGTVCTGGKRPSTGRVHRGIGRSGAETSWRHHRCAATGAASRRQLARACGGRPARGERSARSRNGARGRRREGRALRTALSRSSATAGPTLGAWRLWVWPVSDTFRSIGTDARSVSRGRSSVPPRPSRLFRGASPVLASHNGRERPAGPRPPAPPPVPAAGCNRPMHRPSGSHGPR
jgi:hypothetical protein